MKKLLAFGLVGWLLLVSAPAVGAGPVDAASVAVESDVIDHAIRFRSSVYLNADLRYVERSFEDKEEFADSETWGVPVTAAEGKELQRRVDIQEAIDATSTWADRTFDSYAGTWIDQSRGGLPVLFFKQPEPTLLEELGRHLPNGIAIETRAVSRSWDDLQSLQDRIEAQRDRLPMNGIPLISTGIDTKSNTVLVGLEPVSESAVEAIRRAFGEGITFRDDKSGSHFDAGPYCWQDCLPEKGGIGIYNQQHTAWKCTTGFSVRVTTGTDYHGLVTAGHCDVTAAGDHGIGDNWMHTVSGAPDEGVSEIVNDTWYNGADADVGLSDYFSVPSDLNAFVAWNTGAVNQLTSLASSQPQDGIVTAFAYASGRRVGTITVPNVTRSSDVPGIATKSIDHQWEVNFDSIPGDSGGPYFSGSQGYGIHVDSLDPADHRGWYSTLWWARGEYMSRHGVTFDYCLTNSC
jgi:Trypsin